MSGLLPGKLSRIASARVPSGSNGEGLNAGWLAAGLTPCGNRLAPRDAVLALAAPSRTRRVIIVFTPQSSRPSFKLANGGNVVKHESVDAGDGSSDAIDWVSEFR